MRAGRWRRQNCDEPATGELGDTQVRYIQSISRKRRRAWLITRRLVTTSREVETVSLEMFVVWRLSDYP